jgi:hypothetical protein
MSWRTKLEEQPEAHEDFSMEYRAWRAEQQLWIGIKNEVTMKTRAPTLRRSPPWQTVNPVEEITEAGNPERQAKHRAGQRTGPRVAADQTENEITVGSHVRAEEKSRFGPGELDNRSRAAGHDLSAPKPAPE